MNLSNFRHLKKPQFGLVIGMPTLGSHRAEFTLALHSCGLPLNCVSQVIPILGRSVAEARNLIAHLAKQAGAKYLLFVDEDVILPPNAFRKLIWDLDNNPHISVAAGIYPSKTDPPMPLLFDAAGMGPSYDWHKGDFRKTWAIGMGCTLIRVADLTKLDPLCETVRVENFPTVGYVTECVGYFKDGTAFVKDTEALGGGWALTLTEDLWFCMKCEEAGLNVYADCSITPGHIDGAGNVYELGMCRPYAPTIGDGKPVYLDLGCGGMHRTYEDGSPFLRVDLDPLNHPDYCQDVRALDFHDAVADGVLMSHVLEHLDRHDAEVALDEAVRVTKEGGWICIATPDFKSMLTWYQQNGAVLDDNILRGVFGAQTDEFQYHKSGWDGATLSAALERRGCWIVRVNEDTDVLGVQVWAKKGQKPDEPEQSARPQLDGIQEK